MNRPESIDERCNHTTVSLKEYFQSMLRALDQRLSQSQSDAKEALKVALTANEKRLDLLNEFRAQQADEAKKYVTKDSYNAAHEALSDSVNRLDTQIAKLYGGLVVVAMIGITNLVRLFFVH